MVSIPTARVPPTHTDLFLLGNTGIGKQTVLNLAKRHPARIYLAARTPAKAQAAIAEVQQAVPNAPITFLEMDLTRRASGAEAAKQSPAAPGRLAVLSLNAGVMAGPRGTTADGYEIQLGTNHLGHFLLTRLLLPTLRDTAKQPGADVRVVSITSEAHRMVRSNGPHLFDPEKAKELGPWAAYAQSKLANVLFARELAKRAPEIATVALHPGVIKTDLYVASSDANFLLRAGLRYFGWMWGDVAAGAKNQTWATTCPKAELKSGSYYTPTAVLSPGTGISRDEALAQRLWAWSEGEMEKNGY